MPHEKRRHSRGNRVRSLDVEHVIDIWRAHALQLREPDSQDFVELKERSVAVDANQR